MVLVGQLLFIIGLLSLFPIVPIPGLMQLTASLQEIGKISGPSGYVLIIIGAILWQSGI